MMKGENSARAAILASVDRFVQEKVNPRAADIDRTNEFPHDLWKDGSEIGLFALGVPESYGGLGRDVLTLLLISERIARVSAAFALTFNNTTDSTVPLIHAGSETIKQQYLPAIARGEIVPCISITEPHGGSDVASIRSTAIRKGAHYVLNGRKQWCSNAPVGGVFTIFVKTDPSAGHKGLSAFAIPASAGGLSIGKPEELVGLRGSPVAEIILDNVEVPVDCLLGREGDGFRIAMITLDESRLHCAATAIGVASAAVAHAVEYARVREQFGKRIIQHQGLQFLIADMVTELAAARALWEKACGLLLTNRDREAGLYAGMAKLYCSDLCMRITLDAVQVFGANGLSRAYPVERLMRDAKAFQIYDGTSQIQRSMIGRYIDRNGLPFDGLHVS